MTVMPANAPDVSGDQWGQLMLQLKPLEFSASPAEGATVTLPDTSRQVAALLTPGVDISALTIVLPDEDSSETGQRVFVRCSRNIANATFTAPGCAVDNDTVSFQPGTCVVFFKAGATIWSRVT